MDGNMQFKKLAVLFASLIASTDAYTPLSPKIANKATKKLNKFRHSVHASDMQYVRYDFEAQKKLDTIVAQHANDGHPRWLFEVNQNPPYPFQQNMNGYFIGKEIGMSDPFWGWHDTCAALGQGCVLRNFNFRMNQLGACYDYSSCNATYGSYNRFKSCETALNEIGSGYQCSYAWVYLGKMLRSNVTRIACTVLEQPGWAPPPGQLNSYWCYTDGTTPENDRPYEKNVPRGNRLRIAG